MIVKKKYHGVVVPMVTPVTGEQKIDERALERLVERIISAGAQVFILGTTGESVSVPNSFKLQMAKKVIHQINGRSPVYVGISDNCLDESIEIAKRFADLGADVFVAHLPYYYELDLKQMLEYYEILADNIPRPLMIYNIKSTTHMSISLDVVEKLSYHEKIIGIKDSERDEERLNEAVNRWKNREDFSLMCGWTSQNVNALLKGWDGIVPSSGNVSPELFQNLYQAVHDGDLDTAAELQTKAIEIGEVYQNDRLLGQSLAALKAMMSVMGLCEKTVFRPLTELDEKDLEKLKRQMQKIGLV